MNKTPTEMYIPPRPARLNEATRVQPAVRQARRRWQPWLILAGLALFGLLTLACGASALLLVIATQAAERVPSGVTAGGVDLSGLNTDQAYTRLQTAFAAPTITLTDGDRQWTVPASTLGARVDVDAIMAALATASRNATIPLTYTVDLGQAQLGLVTLSDQVNIEAAPGDPPQMGRALEIPVILDRLRVDPTGELADGLLELNMIVVEPPPPATATIEYDGVTTTHIVEPGQELALIARQYGVSVADIVALNGITNPDLLYIGQELQIPAGGLYQPAPTDAPPAPTSTGKSIVVSTGEQRIYAYENGTLVRSHLVSTGRSATPTVLGDYRVYVKYVADDMAGPGYFLPQVPYTMYFYQGYGIHGTYWHNSFGRPMSHGCVNLPVAEAQWFFDWAEVGTPVRVI